MGTTINPLSKVNRCTQLLTALLNLRIQLSALVCSPKIGGIVRPVVPKNVL